MLFFNHCNKKMTDTKSKVGIELLVDFLTISKHHDEMMMRLNDDLSSRKNLEFSDAEVIVSEEHRKLSLATLQAIVDGFKGGDIGPELITKEGERLTCKRIRKKIIKTLSGEVVINRAGYYKKGQPLRFPLDALLNLPKTSFSYELQRKLVIESARGSFSSASKAVYESYKVVIHKQSIEEIAIAASAYYDEFYEQRSTAEISALEKKLPIIALSLDSKGIVMRSSDLTEQTRKAAESSKRKIAHRLTTGEKLNRKRMATAAAVYSIEAFKRTAEEITSELKGEKRDKEKQRPRPVCKRVWARIEASSEEVADQVFDEGLKRDKGFKKKWVVLVDGDPNQIRRVQKRIKKTNKKAIICLDIIHVIEYLWRAARALFEGEHKKCEEWVTDKLYELLRGSAGYVAAGIRRSATLQKLSNNRRREADIAADYILKNKKFMRYDEYLSEGLPIATGVIEGVCRHVIKDRMDVTGARWTMNGAEAILRLRSLVASGDFEDYWDFYKKSELERNYGDLDVILKKLEVNKDKKPLF